MKVGAFRTTRAGWQSIAGCSSVSGKQLVNGPFDAAACQFGATRETDQ